MNAIVSSENIDIAALTKQLNAVPNMEGLELSSKVTTDTTYTIGEADAKYKIAALDFGIKKNILRNFITRDCFIKCFQQKQPMQKCRISTPTVILFLTDQAIQLRWIMQ
jgi:carbamoyl-phosphate synthase small subunit